MTNGFCYLLLVLDLLSKVLDEKFRSALPWPAILQPSSLLWPGTGSTEEGDSGIKGHFKNQFPMLYEMAKLTTQKLFVLKILIND